MGGNDCTVARCIEEDDNNKFTNSLSNCTTLRDINMILELLLEITMYPKLLPTAAKTVFVVYYVPAM